MKSIASCVQASQPAKKMIDSSAFSHDPMMQEFLDLIKTLQMVMPKGKKFNMGQIGTCLKLIPLIGSYLKSKSLSDQFKDSEFLVYENSSGFKIVLLLSPSKNQSKSKDHVTQYAIEVCVKST